MIINLSLFEHQGYNLYTNDLNWVNSHSFYAENSGNCSFESAIEIF